MYIPHVTRQKTLTLFETINQLAAEIAHEEGLSEGWLNDSVKGFLTPSAKQESYMQLGGLRISTVSPDYLLAMKLIASRYGETDYNDIKFLMEKLDITEYDEAARIVSAYYPPEKILPKTKYVIEEILEEINEPEEDLEL